jgi:hypothetical protein
MTSSGSCRRQADDPDLVELDPVSDPASWRMRPQRLDPERAARPPPSTS